MKDDTDNTIRNRVSADWHDGKGEPFERTWQAAERRFANRRRARLGFASVAAVAAVAAITLFSRAPTETPYIQAAELLETTYWTAPSDALLPDKRFDIYQDLPELFESTEPAEGALL